MTRTKRLLILAVLIALAILCYTFGFARGGTAIFILGMAFELAFWVGILSGRKSKT